MNNGTAAFPSVTKWAMDMPDPASPDKRVWCGVSEMQSGMTLRDWFAGMAMQARIIALGNHEHEGHSLSAALSKIDECHAETAERAYRHADAMLKQRETAL